MIKRSGTMQKNQGKQSNLRYRKARGNTTFSIYIACTIFVVPCVLFGQWQGKTRISNTSNASYHESSRNIAADAANVHIVWEDRSFSDHIRYVGFPIGHPPAAGSGDAVSSGDGDYPSIATDGTNVHIDWYYDNSSPLFMHFREYDGSSWGSIIDHGIGLFGYPNLADDSYGNTHCVYGVHYARRNAGTTNFMEITIPYPGTNHPSICLTSDDAIHISNLTYQGNRVIHAYSDYGTFWSYENVTDSNTASYFYCPSSICRDSDNNLYIAYRGNTPDNSPQQIYVVSGITGSWGTPINVSNGPDECTCPSIACDANDNIWVFWTDRRGQQEEIWYNRFDASTSTWDGAVPLTDNDGRESYTPCVAADPKGNVHVCWTDNRDNIYYPEIYYSWYKGSPPDTTDVTPLDPEVSDLQVISPVSREIVLRYSNYPQGFHAAVFDASGQRVDELHSNLQAGTISWGEEHPPGVYFIRELSSSPVTRKVILMD